jgi:hypothetical protein
MTDAPSTPALPEPCPADEADWARGFAMRRLQILGELAELGLDVARAVERQASGAAEAPVVQGDVALAYARVSRAVRLTLMLQSKLIEALKTGDAAADQARAEAAQESGRFSPEYQRKMRVERIVERLAEAEHPDAEDLVTDLIHEAGERLDDEDVYGDLMERPLSELVARLCKDLGLEPDWADLAGELWAVREIESGQVGWPLEGLAQTRPPPLAGGRDRSYTIDLDAQRAGGVIPPPPADSERDLLRRSIQTLEAAESAFGRNTG